MDRNFWRLFLSQAAANIGDVLYIVALITVIYELYQSVFLLSLLPFIITICKFSCGMLSPIILDRFKLKGLLFSTQLIKIGLFLVLTILLFSNHIELWWILLLVAGISIADGIQQPVTFALIPSLVKEKYLLKANSATSVSFQTSDLLTWSLGAILVTVMGYEYSLIITMALYLMSLMLVAMIRVNVVNEEKEESAKEHLFTLKDSLTEGWVLILSNPLLKKFLWMDVVKGISYTVWVAAVLYVFVDEVLNVSQEWWGYINTARILGSLLGGFIIYKFADRMNGRLKDFLFYASLSVAVISLCFGFNTVPLLALGLVFLLGFPEQMDDIIQTTMIQERIKEKQLAKVYTAQSMVYYFVFAFAVLGAGILVDLLNVQLIFILASLLLFINSIIAWGIKRKINTDNSSNKKELDILSETIKE
ncbi:MFS transporter [Metaplanococcus flavidus]|uniref:MFS transporter n=1 Tax=Metaplanococcus flavidus TaxID=569883 RepID=A0ABW3LDL6_9BACL